MPTMQTTTTIPSRCGGCGGLTCSCRPRFVDQQRLDADDLNALVDYTRTRARMQNQLMGWGVACGLGVDHQTGGQVTVAPGRALSPCGEDIVVPDAQQLSICDLIDCWATPGTIRCRPGEPVTRPDRIAEWELRVRYVERPLARRSAARSTAAAACSCGERGSTTPSGGCGCGSGGGGCDCGRGASSCGCSTRNGTAGRPRAESYAVCDPGVICDSFCFEVRPHVAPVAEPDEQRVYSRVFREVRSPLAALAIKPLATKAVDQRVEVVGHLTELSQLELLPEAMRKEAATLAADTTTSSTAMFDAARIMLGRTGRALGRAAFCEAVNPPCPPATDDDSVLVAVVTVTPGRCEVTKVCTAGRRLVVSGAAVQHWASMVFETNPLEQICCHPPTGVLGLRSRREWQSASDMADEVLDEIKAAFRSGLGRLFGSKD